MPVEPRAVEDTEYGSSKAGTKTAWIGLAGTVGAAVIAGAVALYIHWTSERNENGSNVSVSASGADVAIGGGVRGDINITQTLDPAGRGQYNRHIN